jgi:hypothetical protein
MAATLLTTQHHDLGTNLISHFGIYVYDLLAEQWVTSKEKATDLLN